MRKSLFIAIAVLCSYLSFAQTAVPVGTPVQSGFRLNGPLPLDMRWGKYDTAKTYYRAFKDTGEANRTINRLYRFRGLTVGIADSAGLSEWCWADGIENSDLVPKARVGQTSYDSPSKTLSYWTGKRWQTLFIITDSLGATTITTTDGYVLITTDGHLLSTTGSGGSGGASDGNNYPTSLVFNPTTKILTLNRSGLSPIFDTIPYEVLSQGTGISIMNSVVSSTKHLSSLSVTGTNTKTIVATLQDGTVISGTFNDISGGSSFDTSALSLNTRFAEKVDKILGKQLSTEDYTTSEKSKLAGIAAGATNVTNNNQIANGAAYITNSALGPYALSSSVPTNTNQLANGAGFLTAEVDPKRVTGVSVTGGVTKTLTITKADATTVSTTFTDSVGGGGAAIDTSLFIKSNTGITEEPKGVRVSGQIWTSGTLSAMNYNTGYGSYFTPNTVNIGVSGNVQISAGGSGNVFIYSPGGDLTLRAGGNSAKILSNGGVFIPDSSPPSTPSGGGVIYVEGGALKYKGSSGTVTTLGAP